jgi:hypothetical protein
MEAMKDDKTEVKDQADKITTDIEASNDEVSKLFKKKDELRNEFYKNKYDFEV